LLHFGYFFPNIAFIIKTGFYEAGGRIASVVSTPIKLLLPVNPAGIVLMTTFKPNLLKMIKFKINDEVHKAGFGIREMLFVWKINHGTNGDVTYTCSATKGRDEKVYTDKEIYYQEDLYLYSAYQGK